MTFFNYASFALLTGGGFSLLATPFSKKATWMRVAVGMVAVSVGYVLVFLP